MKWVRYMWADLRAAFSFLTILPFGYTQGRKPGWSFSWYPLVGLFIGGMLAFIRHLLAFRPAVCELLILFIWVIITGALHLDGFGDSCDGLLATCEPARRLEIMKDPRTGSWAVIGLMLLLLGKFTLIGQVPSLLLLIAPVAGRWVMVAAAYTFPYARSNGLGAYFRDGLGRTQMIASSVFTLGIILITSLLNPAALLALVISPLVILLFGRWAAKRLGGGLTGDTYGALCELTELLCLLGWAWQVN